jgi:hypothetical protein
MMQPVDVGAHFVGARSCSHFGHFAWLTPLSVPVKCPVLSTEGREPGTAAVDLSRCCRASPFAGAQFTISAGPPAADRLKQILVLEVKITAPRGTDHHLELICPFAEAAADSIMTERYPSYLGRAGVIVNDGTAALAILPGAPDASSIRAGIGSFLQEDQAC